MSDYLWDKSGEPDAEVERLEELFNGLRYQPRELELPPAAQTPEQRTRRSYWPMMAVAASLILTGIAGLWLVRHRNVNPNSEAGASVLAAAPLPDRAQPQERRNAPATAGVIAATVNGPANEIEKRSLAGVERPHRQGSGDRVLTHSARTHEPGAAAVETLRPHASDAPREGQEVASFNGPGRRQQLQQEERAEGLRAKEELMLALQVASTTLNHAQRKAKGETFIHGPVSKPTDPASLPWNKSR